MTNEQTTVLVLKDNTGDYFLLPKETLEQGRVPEEHKAEVEQLVTGHQDDVRGHSTNDRLFTGLAGLVRDLTAKPIVIPEGTTVYYPNK